jgi:hypothetical protein
MIHLSGCLGAANTNDSLSAVRRLTVCGKPYVSLRQRRWLVTKKSSCYCCLYREPNAVVAPIHPKAIPVILTTPEERDVANPSCLPVNRSKPRGSICVSAVQTLRDGWGSCAGPPKPPIRSLCTICLTGGFYSEFTGMFSASPLRP